MDANGAMDLPYTSQYHNTVKHDPFENKQFGNRVLFLLEFHQCKPPLFSNHALVRPFCLKKSCFLILFYKQNIL